MNVKEFSFSCVSLFNYQGSCRLTAPTFYHIVFRLSSTFLKSFFAAFRHLCSFATAILDYHICISLSRTFFNFLKLFSVFFDYFVVVLRQLDYNIICFNICQYFFFFFIFFFLFAQQQLLHNIIFYLLCQALFVYFFVFISTINTNKEGKRPLNNAFPLYKQSIL